MRIPFLALTLLTSAAGAQSVTPSRGASDTTRVVFVCEHGAVKSVIAAALFNRMAAERGLAARAVSRGTAPDEVVPLLVRDALRAEGTDIAAARPVALTADEPLDARLFVAFDIDVPAAVSRGTPVRRWDGTPSVMSGGHAGRDAIAARVAELVAELERASRTTAPPRR